MKDPGIEMRRCFADTLGELMAQDERIWVLSGDLGYKMWDQIRAKFPDRFINTGAAEQSMIGMAIGLSLEGKIPVVYSISSFLLYRPFEAIRNYIHHEKIAVKLVGAGRDRDYLNDGFSHWSPEDRAVMKIFSNIEAHWPESVDEVKKLTKKMLKKRNPWYLNLRR